jgi:Flp pilus assembly protein TadG
MKIKSQLWNLACNRFRREQSLDSRTGSKGQALVEFTLVFILLLIIAWIPADFGLAFYTAQLAGNAARDGARIAAADPNVAGQVGTCTIRVNCNDTTGSVMDMVSKRVASALMPATTITVALLPPTSVSACDSQVSVRVQGNYNYFFYRILRYIGGAVPSNTVNIVRQNNMRWEHQC